MQVNYRAKVILRKAAHRESQ